MNPTAIRLATDGLIKQVREAVAQDYKPDNPITRALGQQHFEQTASPDMKVVADQLRSLTTRISSLEDGRGNSLAGVVSHPFFVQVMLVPDLSKDDRLQLAAQIMGMMPNASISEQEDNLWKVYFQSTNRGAHRTMEAIDRLPWVVDCSAPISRRVEQGSLF